MNQPLLRQAHYHYSDGSQTYAKDNCGGINNLDSTNNSHVS